MKKPRLADFDPSPKAAELHSPLDDMPAIEKAGVAEVTQPPVTADPAVPSAPESAVDSVAQSPVQSADQTISAVPDERPFDGTSVRSFVRPSVRIGKRTKTRYSFEFYQDQLDSLRDFSLEEKRRGEQGNMSAMVREAIDAYVAKRRRLDG